MDNRLHPVIQQALRPFMPPTQADLQAADIAVARWQAGHHERNQAQALRLQVAEQSRNEVNWTMV